MTPPVKKQKVMGSSPDVSYRTKKQCWSVYKVKRRIVFDDVTPTGIHIGTLLATPVTPGKTYKPPGLPVPTEQV